MHGLHHSSEQNKYIKGWWKEGICIQNMAYTLSSAENDQQYITKLMIKIQN